MPSGSARRNSGRKPTATRAMSIPKWTRCSKMPCWKVSFLMATATALTALYGFPPNAIITEATCTALAQTPEEKEFLMSKMFPPMIVGGFTTVTITSVVIAGIFAEMF